MAPAGDLGDRAGALTIGELGLPLAGDQPEHANHPMLANLTGQPVLVAGHARRQTSFRSASRARSGVSRTGPVHGADRIRGIRAHRSRGVGQGDRARPPGPQCHVSQAAEHRAGTGLALRAALPQDDEGIALPVEPSTHGEQAANESERFFVVELSDEEDDGLDDLAAGNRANLLRGLTQALRAFQFKAIGGGRDWRAVQCRKIEWKARGTARQELRASFGRAGTADIHLSPVLADIQRELLADPGRPPSRLRITVDGDQSHRGVRDEMNFVRAAASPVETFLMARTAVLRAVRDDDDLPVEGRDLPGLRPVVQAYAEAYFELLRWQQRQAERADDTERGRLLADLGEMLAVDTVEASVTGPDAVRRTVVLASPLQPLRLLWLVTWAELGQHWLESPTDADTDTMEAAGRSLGELTPLGFPFVVPLRDGRLTIAAADFTTYWGVCLPTDAPDPQGLLASLAHALRLPERGGGHAGPATRARGPGRALPASASLRVHTGHQRGQPRSRGAARGHAGRASAKEAAQARQLRHPDLRPRRSTERALRAGEALAALLRGEWTTAADAEAFSTRQASGLIPKLAVAVTAAERVPSGHGRAAVAPDVPVRRVQRRDGSAPRLPRRARARCPCTALSRTSSSSTAKATASVLWRKQPRHGHGDRVPRRPGAVRPARARCPPPSRPPPPQSPPAKSGPVRCRR